MSYKPPHLRSSGASSGPGATGVGVTSTSASANLNGEPAANGSSNSFGYNRGGSGYGAPAGSRGGYDSGYGFGRSGTGGYDSRGGGYDSRGSAGGGGGGASQRRPSDRTEVVFPKWSPSERVLSLTEAQVNEIRGRLSISVAVEEGQPPAQTAIESFKDMNLHAHIMEDIALHKYNTPTPIQAQGIPVALSGRDILGCAETGSGKTASFAIPMVQHCLHQSPVRPGDGPMAMVLAPTRELAQQIEKEVKAFSGSSRSLKTAIVVGGAQISEQRHDLRSGVAIVVATPGRFIDHLQQGNTNLQRVSYVVLDEADRMLDMGFEPQIRDVLQALPPKHQTLLFSATMPVEIEGLASAYLQHPVTIKVGQVSTPTASVAQQLERTTDGEKQEMLLGLLHNESENAAKSGLPLPLTVVFVERKNKCSDVASLLTEGGIAAVALHGGLTQGERERALRDFTTGRCRVLVATDVASRGLDIDGIGHVVNMDLPRSFEDYVHRIGRTGRAGLRGRATSLYTDKDAFLVSQIKSALAMLESGNVMAFATGKAARQEERVQAQKFRDNMGGSIADVETAVSDLQLGSKYAFMAKTASVKSGTADAAWDD